VTAAVRKAGGTPVLAAFLDARGAPAALEGIPTFTFPEGAARALARVERYARWRRTPPGPPPSFEDFDEPRARDIVEGALGRGAGWLTPDETAALLAAAGLPVVPGRMARTEAEACAAAVAAGLPVAVKAFGPTIVHKSDVGGVRLGVTEVAGVAAAWRDMRARLGPALEGVVVQPMAPDGVEILVGAVQHALFGPLVACGAGGTLAEILKDTAYRLTPLTTTDAGDMIASLRVAPLLRGFRGAPPADTQALRDALLRLSRLVDACPTIQEVDLNPVRVLADGLVVLDARVRVERITPTPSRRIWY
jgi:acyl-CoA synthetase (NDP forming)